MQQFLNFLISFGLSASQRLQDDGEIVRSACRNFGMSIEFASSRLRNDFDTCLVAVTQSGFALRELGPQTRHNERIISRAIAQAPWALRECPCYLLNDLQSLRGILIAAGFQHRREAPGILAQLGLPQTLLQVDAVAGGNDAI